MPQRGRFIDLPPAVTSVVDPEFLLHDMSPVKEPMEARAIVDAAAADRRELPSDVQRHQRSSVGPSVQARFRHWTTTETPSASAGDDRGVIVAHFSDLNQRLFDLYEQIQNPGILGPVRIKHFKEPAVQDML